MGPGAPSENILLAALPETERREVLRSCTTASFRRGDYLFHAGEAGDSLHLVTRGRVAVYVGSVGAVGTADPVLLTVTGPGEFFGEMALIEGGTRTATVRALEPTGTLRLGRPAFSELRDRYPAVERLLTVALVERVRRLTGQVDELVNVPAEARICRRILTLADLYGGEGGDQPIPVTQGDLAAMAGAGLRITSRVLGQVREAGLIETGVRRIVVLDVVGLRSRAGLSR